MFQIVTCDRKRRLEERGHPKVKQIDKQSLVNSILLGVILSACANSTVTPSEADHALGKSVGVPDEQLLLIKKQGANLRQLEGMSDAGEPLRAPGITIDVSEKKALPVVLQLRKELGAEHLVFVSERNFGIGGTLDQVSVFKGNDPFDMLRTMGTNGWNYDLSPDDVIARLQQWDAAFGLDMQGVGFDWLEATFFRKPTDMAAFAEQVYEFCPDVVDQGTDTVEALAEEMRRTNTLYLWWD